MLFSSIFQYCMRFLSWIHLKIYESKKSILKMLMSCCFLLGEKNSVEFQKFSVNGVLCWNFWNIIYTFKVWTESIKLILSNFLPWVLKFLKANTAANLNAALNKLQSKPRSVARKKKKKVPPSVQNRKLARMILAITRKNPPLRCSHICGDFRGAAVQTSLMDARFAAAAACLSFECFRTGV